MSEGLEEGVEALHGEAHDVEETAAQLLDGDEAYPLLDAIGAGLVEGKVVVYVEADFVFGEGGKLHVGADREGFKTLSRDHRHAGDDLMGAARKTAEHAHGVVGLTGFAEDVAVDVDGGVGGDEQFVGRHRGTVGFGFFAGNIGGHLFAGKVGGVAFVHTEQGAHFEFDAKTLQEFFATGRVAGKDNFVF